MTRYYFHVHEDERADFDPVGRELSDDQSAKREGLAMAGMLIEDLSQKTRGISNWRLDVADIEGRLVCRFQFSVRMPNVTQQ